MKPILQYCCRLLVVMGLAFPSMVQSSTQPVDPHGKEGMCKYCHISQEVSKGRAELWDNNIGKLCQGCHKARRHVKIREYLQIRLPDIEAKDRIISYFAKQPDFSCITCHDMICLTDSPKQLLNKDPHVQLDSDGAIIERACLSCHTSVPDYRKPDSADTEMRYEISNLCVLCHVMSSERIKMGHGEQMTTQMINTKKEFEEKYDISIPLGPGNRVICASCHKPHQAGVILGKGKKYGNKPRNHRLILLDYWALCDACHPGYNGSK